MNRYSNTQGSTETGLGLREGSAEPEDQRVQSKSASSIASPPAGFSEVEDGLIAVAEDGKPSASSTASGSRERLAAAPSEGTVNETLNILNPRQRPTISPEETFRLLGINRSTGYKAIQDGTFPVTVLRVGRLIRIPTGPLARLLQAEFSPPIGNEAG